MPAADLTPEHALEAVMAGPSMWGSVYVSRRRPRCYRLISNDQLGAGSRAELHELKARPRRPGIAPVIDERGDQREFAHGWFQVVSYELAADFSLADSLADPDPARRLRDLARVLRAVPGWWERATGFLPMPSDIVFTHDRPHLLAMPTWGAPGVAALFDDPGRIAYLAPEISRGVTDTPGRAQDMFALAVMVLQALCTPPEEPAQELLRRAACSALYPLDRCESRIPLWMRGLEPVRAVLDEATRLTSPDQEARAGADPLELAALLERCARGLDPGSAVLEVREAGDPGGALRLAQTVLMDEPVYEVLLLAADIAWRDLGSPVAGLAYLDRAILTRPERHEAYEAQLELVHSAPREVLSHLIEAVDEPYVRRLDDLVLRAFERLPRDRKRPNAHRAARYLLGRGHVGKANRLIYEWLYDGPTLMWWQFDLMLDYAESFLLADRLDQAQELIMRTKDDLRRMRGRSEMTEATRHGHGVRLAALERLIVDRRQGGAR